MRRTAFIGAALLAASLSARSSRAAESARDACEAALALEQQGAKVSSRAPCHRAMLVDYSAQDMRNEVASLLSPHAHPSMDDLVVAGLLVDAAMKKSPDEPWGYLARCDIARRLGSADVMEACLADLQRFAPNHAATKQAFAAPLVPGAPWRWTVRVLLLALVLGTIAHALRRGLRATRAAKGAPSKIAAAFVLVIFASLAGATLEPSIAAAAPGDEAMSVENDHLKDLKKDQLSKFKIDDANPEASVPSPAELMKEPLQMGYLIQDLGGKADAAVKRKDHGAAVRFYRALIKITPQSAFGPRKLCEELEASGNPTTAIMACRTAITLDGATTNDFVHFVNLSLARPGKLAPLEQKELEAVVAHLAAEPNLGTVPATLRCEVALRVGDTKALESCTAELGKAAQNDPKTISYEWALAVQKRDQSGALGLIDRARQAGVSAEGLAIMEKTTQTMVHERIIHVVTLVVGAALLGLALALGLRWFANRRRASV
jgi:hypothetical protein